MTRADLIKKAKRFYHKGRVPSSFEMLVVTLNAKDLYGLMVDFHLSVSKSEGKEG